MLTVKMRSFWKKKQRKWEKGTEEKLTVEFVSFLSQVADMVDFKYRQLLYNTPAYVHDT